jgi:hypothetical protein
VYKENFKKSKKNKMEIKEKNLGQIQYGLVVTDPTANDNEILHFCGYWERPTQKDADSLREELKNDPEFGLQDIADKVDIVLASKDILEMYQKIISSQENNNL